MGADSEQFFLEQFDGDVPKTIEDLLILPGVGPKMGFLCLQAAWGIQVGIGVDTHVSAFATEGAVKG